MAGQIVKRGERTFLVRVFLGRNADGKRKYLNETVRGTKKEAQAVLNKLLRAKDLGALALPSGDTLNEYLDHWLEAAAKPRLRASTYLEYKAQLVRYVRPELGHVKLSKLTPVAIQACYGKMLAAGLSARTVRLTHAILRNALHQAVKWQVLPYNPADAVDLPKQQQEEMKALSREEAARFLEVSKGNRWHVLFTLLLATGLRPSEAIALKWTDLDLAGGRLHVTRTVAKVEGRWVFNEPKTKSGRRVVYLPVSLVRLLADQPRVSELVFIGDDGEPVRLQGVIEHHFKPLLVKAGLPREVRLYDLRHTCATLLLLAGEHPKKVAERLGHADISLTLNTYSHVLPGMQREGAEKLEALLFQGADAAVPAYN